MTNPNIDRPIIDFKIVGEIDGQYKIKFTNTEFDDIIVSIRGVSFEEREDEAVMKFDYDIHEGKVPEEDLIKFKQLLGDFILQGIEAGLKTNSVVYKGGVDEN
jgi:hypothetical protein